jgi:UDP-N-acetyl-D-mannosaminuronic acid transferase (WecB/TagA/CpsF family)
VGDTNGGFGDTVNAESVSLECIESIFDLEDAQVVGVVNGVERQSIILIGRDEDIMGGVGFKVEGVFDVVSGVHSRELLEGK